MGSGPRICIDFGTALSKASLCLDDSLPAREAIMPLPIGAAAGASQPLLTPSALFFGDDRILLGPSALAHAETAARDNREAILSFKTVLGASNIRDALGLRVRPSIDPTGSFSQRDILIIYLAYLDQLIQAALQESPGAPLEASRARRRYTSPVWRHRRSRDVAFEDLFQQAATVSAIVGPALLAATGLPLDDARQALAEASSCPGPSTLEAGVFEAHAAAAAFAAFTSDPAPYCVVIDMGAGTTDLAAFSLAGETGAIALEEIPASRQCSSLAGDELDKILIDVMLRKYGSGLDRNQGRRLSRALKLGAREMKASLFGSGRCALKHAGRAMGVSRSEVTGDRLFRDFRQALADAVIFSVGPAVRKAREAKVAAVSIVLAGGGAKLPFLTQLVRTAAEKVSGGIRIKVANLASGDISSEFDSEVQASFSQLAVSMGGALLDLKEAKANAGVA